jgi:xylose isomerase
LRQQGANDPFYWRYQMADFKYSTGLWLFGNTGDRFNLAGYKENVPIADQIRAAATVKGIRGVECHQTDFDEINPREYAKIVSDCGLVTTNVNTNIWGSAKWMHGAFAHRDPKVRADAIAEAKRSVDVAREVSSPSAGLWLGADGFDYPFQIDYTTQWDLLTDGIRQVAEYAAPDIRIGVEYKLREPRNRMTVGDAGKALALALEIGMDNVGCVIDFGHALQCKESPGESVAIFARHNKLFNVHFNDSFRDWDDDMIVGTVHVWETLEFLYYCKETNYQGWFGLDMFPYRENGVAAAQMAIDNIEALAGMLDKIDFPALKAAQQTMDAVETQKVARKAVFG